MHILSEFRLIRKSDNKKSNIPASVKTSSDLMLGGLTGAGIGATIPILSSAKTPRAAKKFADSSKSKLFNNRLVGNIGKQSRALKKGIALNLNTPLQSKLAITGLGLGLGATAANKIRKRLKNKTK